MRIEITELSEHQVEMTSEMLDQQGFVYDADYTTLYGFRSALVGLRFDNIITAQTALTFLSKGVKSR